jgi:hypothetical protein
MHREIKHEERVLAEKFADEFDRYRSAVPYPLAAAASSLLYGGTISARKSVPRCGTWTAASGVLAG